MSDSIDVLSTPSTAQPGNFAKEEWEDWMKWDGPLESLSANTPGHTPPLQFVSGSLGSTSPSEFDSLPPIDFSPVYALPTTESKKRKSSAITANGNGSTGTGRQPRGKKISHNVIEKRYRSNLNDKIAKLRDSVPELRSAQPTVKRRPQKPACSDSEGSGDEGSQGLKFNKATVLIKATEYIQQLERQNQRLLAEVSTLRNRNGPKHQLQTPPVISTAVTTTFENPTIVTSHAAEKPKEQEKEQEPTANKETSVEGLIKVPEDIRRLREEVPPQPHYAPESSSSATESTSVTPWSEVKGMIPLSESWQRFRAQTRTEEHYAPASPVSQVPELDNSGLQDDDEDSRWSRSRLMSRVLVGSLAGLMIMEGFNEREEDSPPLTRRGLFSLPSDLLTESRGFRVPIRKRIDAFAASGRARQALPILAFSFCFLFVCFAIFLYLHPEGSKAIREGPIEAKAAGDDSQSTSTDSPASSAESSSSGSYTPPQLEGHGSSTLGELYALKLVRFLGLSWLISQTHDEEAISHSNNGAIEKGKRWLTYLRVIPKFGEEFN